MTRIEKSRGALPAEAASSASDASSALAGPTNALLPTPFYPNGPPVDDLQTALSLLMIQASRDKRTSADAENAAGEKAQEAALARKIDKMRELADDTFAQGLVEGAFQGLSAVAEVGSAECSFSGAMSEVDSKATLSPLESESFARTSALSARTAKLIDASGKAMSAAGAIWAGATKRAQESDREDLAVIDHDIERTKGTVEAASTESKRAQDDVRQTMDAIRQYLAAKTQAAQAVILKA